MKAIEWLYDKEFEYVFKNIGKDLWEDLRQEVAVIVLEYDSDKLVELQSKGKQVFKFWIVRICCNQTNSKYGKFGRMYAALVPVEDVMKFVKEEEENVYQMFRDCVEEEKSWAEYLFRDGSMIGLNDKLLNNYVEWIANRRMKAIGLKPLYDIPAKNNPLPWTEHWISSKGLQVAPQETEVESYIVGGIKQDVTKDTFSGFQL